MSIRAEILRVCSLKCKVPAGKVSAVLEFVYLGFYNIRRLRVKPLFFGDLGHKHFFTFDWANKLGFG